MNQQYVDMFMATNGKNFPEERLFEIQQRMLKAPDEVYNVMQAMSFKDTTNMLLFSIFLGELGIDRFLLDDIGMGILKLLTAGCCGILWIIDIINMSKMTKDYNYKKLNTVLGY